MKGTLNTSHSHVNSPDKIGKRKLKTLIDEEVELPPASPTLNKMKSLVDNFIISQEQANSYLASPQKTTGLGKTINSNK